MKVFIKGIVSFYNAFMAARRAYNIARPLFQHRLVTTLEKEEILERAFKQL